MSPAQTRAAAKLCSSLPARGTLCPQRIDHCAHGRLEALWEYRIQSDRQFVKRERSLSQMKTWVPMCLSLPVTHTGGHGDHSTNLPKAALHLYLTNLSSTQACIPCVICWAGLNFVSTILFSPDTQENSYLFPSFAWPAPSVCKQAGERYQSSPDQPPLPSGEIFNPDKEFPT